MFQYTYPRLDDHVSTGVNHLLKAPFCAHPKTGKICVPIDPKTCDKFDPFTSPTLAQLCGEDNRVLNPYLEYFKKFLDGLDIEAKELMRERRAAEDKKMIF